MADGDWRRNVKGQSTGGHHDSSGLQYQRFVKLVKRSLTSLEQAGIEYEIVGMLWMQGESDAVNQSRAQRYEKGLIALIKDVREVTRSPQMAFLIGQINSQWDTNPPGGAALVRSAQEKVAKTLENVYCFDTTSLARHGDKCHINTEGTISLGKTYASICLEKVLPKIK